MAYDTSAAEPNKREKTVGGTSVDHRLGRTVSADVAVAVTIGEACRPERIIAVSGNLPAADSITDKGKLKMVVDIDGEGGSNVVFGTPSAADLSCYSYSLETFGSHAFCIPTVDGGYSTFTSLSAVSTLPAHIESPLQAEGFSSPPQELRTLTSCPADSIQASAVCGSGAVTTWDFSAGVVSSIPSSSTEAVSCDTNSASQMNEAPTFTSTNARRRPPRAPAFTSAIQQVIHEALKAWRIGGGV